MRSLGLVLDEERGALPYALVHGEALVACAAWALGEAGVRLLDVGTPWSQVQESGEPVVLHDALCPLTPPDFIARCLEHALDTGAVTVGVRPVTDTVKRVSDGVVGDTVDRDALVAVASPVVLPASVVASLDDGLPTPLLPPLVSGLARTVAVESLPAPAAARRVADRDELAVLEALTAEGA